jgi:hypothetical protein
MSRHLGVVGREGIFQSYGDTSNVLGECCPNDAIQEITFVPLRHVTTVATTIRQIHIVRFVPARHALIICLNDRQHG